MTPIGSTSSNIRRAMEFMFYSSAAPLAGTHELGRWHAAKLIALRCCGGRDRRPGGWERSNCRRRHAWLLGFGRDDTAVGTPAVSHLPQESGPVPQGDQIGLPKECRDLVYTRRGEEASRQVDNRVALSRAAVVYAGPVGSP